MTPTDPLYASQWQFDLLGTLGGTRLIQRIWDDYNGSGVHVGIYDEGVQYTHYELDSHYDSSRNVTTAGVVRDGAPAGNAPHGTSVAGLIAAENNGIDGIGVAWNASITSVNIFNSTGGAYVNSSNITNFLSAVHQSTNFDVTNNSWGSTPSFANWQNLTIANSFDALTTAQYGYAAINGRGGLGTIIARPPATTISTPTAMGSTHRVSPSPWAPCAPTASRPRIRITAPTFWFQPRAATPARRAIVTTDLLGTQGYNLSSNPTGSSNYTDRFGGTSAATPIVTGVVALMLDANPHLGWRDVQDILALSALHTGGAMNAAAPTSAFENNTWFFNHADDWNGGGQHFSEDYGYGAIDAYAAVRMAEVWDQFGVAQTSGNEMVQSTGTIAVNQPINDLSTLSYQFNLAGNVVMEHADLTIKITHTDFTDLRIFLDSPEGTDVQLYDGRSGNSSTSDAGLTWTCGIDAFHGELSSGTWTLRIVDAAANDVGTLNTVALNVYGSAPSVDNVYHYTDEFAAAAAIEPGRVALTDTDGGTDTIDAVAVTANSIINLNGGSVSLIAGQPLTISASTTIENAFTGDGNDIIIGNSAANHLVGGRGDDRINGGRPGNDVLDGGAGTDTAVLSGDHGDFTLTFDTTGADFTVADQRAGTPDGVDTVTRVEVFQFVDGASTYNSAGTITSQIINDVVDDVPWSSQVSSFDTQGHLASADGQRRQRHAMDEYVRHPQYASSSWQTNSFDGAGQIETQTGLNDDGTHWLTLFDADNAYSWSNATITFDADWNQTSVTGTNDDGSHTVPTDQIEAVLDTVNWFRPLSIQTKHPSRLYKRPSFFFGDPIRCQPERAGRSGAQNIPRETQFF